MNFVLVHGAWHGGWCWSPVADLLRRGHHRVFTPTLTGLGERAHLLSAGVGLSTFIDDVCAVIDNEELQEVVLVGHSFAGLVISGVADRMPERLRRLIYLDAVVAEDGQSAMSMLTPEVREVRSRTIDAEGLRMAIPETRQFGVTDPGQAEWLRRRLTPHPARSYLEPLRLRRPLGNGVPKTYIAATDPCYSPLAQVRDKVKGQAGWDWLDLPAGHDGMVTAAGSLAGLLMIAARPAVEQA